MRSLAELEAPLRKFLDAVLPAARLRCTYRFVSHPAGAERDFENPDLLVDFEGPDMPLLLADNGELLRSLEHLAHEALRLGGDEHERVVFDCQNRRMLRIDELRLAADLAAQKVIKTGVPYSFGPMSSRERRVIHMALRGVAGIVTASEGVGVQRHVVIQPQRQPPAPTRVRPREIRRL